jgi:(p)ppGpp synthase/HD superfamily hydrolase
MSSLLAVANADEEVVAAGVLHDVLGRAAVRPAELQARFGMRIATVVTALTEDRQIAAHAKRKCAVRARAVAGGADAHLVFAADRIARQRELRARSPRHEGEQLAAEDRRRLEHYRRGLCALQQVAPEAVLVKLLEVELWSLEALPPTAG